MAHLTRVLNAEASSSGRTGLDVSRTTESFGDSKIGTRAGRPRFAPFCFAATAHLRNAAAGPCRVFGAFSGVR